MATTPEWEDPFSPNGTREATAKILTGMNYRLFYEEATQQRLMDTYRELAALARQHPSDDDAWRGSIRELARSGTPQDRRLRYWLIGLTKKTADNLGVSAQDYPELFDRMMASIEQQPAGLNQREMALLLWCGTATLTIRGAQKSKIGKSLERAIARASLTILGLNEEAGQFRMNVGADEEVERETDAEVQTPRGYVRIEVGLIGRGNSEVISDKVGRLSRNDVIIMDILPTKSAAYQTAENQGVRLIQLRNNHPVEEFRSHLMGLRVPVSNEPISVEEVERRVLAMPLTSFSGR